jgi:hypothetical protein
MFSAGSESAVAVLGPLLASLAPTAAAAGNQVAGSSFCETADQCPDAPIEYAGFDSYPALVMSGSLVGCLYTKVESTHETPSGVYLETGEEVFVGSLDGGASGTFSTTYRFEST